MKAVTAPFCLSQFEPSSHCDDSVMLGSPFAIKSMLAVRSVYASSLAVICVSAWLAIAVSYVSVWLPSQYRQCLVPLVIKSMSGFPSRYRQCLPPLSVSVKSVSGYPLSIS